MNSFSLQRTLLFIMTIGGASSAWAELSFTAQGTMFYTNDVGIFSATRRLTRDGDPTQPALDSNLTGQGSDFVFEPQAKMTQSFANRFGSTLLNLQGSGFIYADNTRYNNGVLLAQITQVFTSETSLLFRYYYSPNLFLGENEERQTGTFQIVGESVTSNIWSARLSQELTPGLEAKLLVRYGLRRYNQAFSERNTNFWTIGPHLEWKILPTVTLGLSYHYERGLAAGRNQPEYEDDVSYINNYASIDFEMELSERLSFSTAFHYERNNWTSSLEGDERNGAHENVYQGEVILVYRLNEIFKTYTGVQYSSRKESFELDAAKNLNIGLGITATF